MAIFKSNRMNHCVSMRINGVNRYFDFLPKGREYTCGICVVQDPKIAAALHKHPMYGIDFVELEEAKVETKQEKKFVAVYPDVTKSQEAIAILVEKHGVTDAAGLKTKAAIKKVAEELNISFPNL